MTLRFWLLPVLLLLVLPTAWTKDKLDPNALMARSDAVYYYPAAHGIRDLAVDLQVEQFTQDPALKDVKVSFYYAGEERQRFIMTGFPDKYATRRESFQALIDAIGEFIMPRPSGASFTGLDVTAEKVYRQIMGEPDTTYYQLIATPKEDTSPVKAYRVLIDAQGLAHQVENVQRAGGSIVAKIENVQIGGLWHIAGVTTRIIAKTGTQWKIDRVAFGDVQGYPLPQRFTSEYRDGMNLPSKDMTGITIQFVNYRINQGIAVAALDAAEKPPAPDTMGPVKSTTPAP